MQSFTTLDVDGGTSEFRLGSKWFKAFHQNPAKKDVEVTDQYISFTSAAPSPTCTLQNQEYNNLCIHTSFAKPVYTCPSRLSFLTVQIISSPIAMQRTYLLLEKCLILCLSWKRLRFI